MPDKSTNWLNCWKTSEAWHHTASKFPQWILTISVCTRPQRSSYCSNGTSHMHQVCRPAYWCTRLCAARLERLRPLLRLSTLRVGLKITMQAITTNQYSWTTSSTLLKKWSSRDSPSHWKANSLNYCVALINFITLGHMIATEVHSK